MTKNYTIKELATLTNIPAGTIRSWIMKPIDGVPYSSENINYGSLREKLSKYFPDFDQRFGFSIEDVEIVKGERASAKQYLTIEELTGLERDAKIILHNYSLKTELTFLKYDEELSLFIFKSADGHKAYDTFALDKKNIKIEKVEEA